MSTPCFGIIFEKVTNNKVTGHKLFQSFIKENKACFWNMKLGEAINSMKYVGYIKPSTLFITSLNENHMQTLRDAWVQQILRSAKGYRIKTFGDVESIGIHKIDQIHLVPLLDIVCDVVAKMNQSGRPAVLQTLQNEIGKEYPEIKTPSMRTLRQAIQTLLKQKTLKYDLKQLRICFPSTPPYRSKKITITKCTVECQTGQSVANGYTPSNHFKTKKNLLARLFMKKDCAQKVSQPIEHCRNRTRLRGHPERPTISAECNNDVVMPSKTKKIFKFCDNELDGKCRKTKVPGKFIQRNTYSCTLCQNCRAAEKPKYSSSKKNNGNMKDVMSRDRKSKKKVNERDQLSTSAHRDFDSAFSLSPAVTEVSNECCSSQLEDMSHNEPTIKQLNHTYVNIWSNESTQFEDVTQTEKTLPATISITNV